ncbi:MAG: PH domain-containing protein [Acidobacteria bacterium]|nr:PH domain-containing protein [Acidobacteriota bacterium]
MKERLLALLRVPERPDPPPGAGEALETFRAAPAFFYYSILAWIPKQAAALAGLFFSLAFFGGLDNQRIDFMQAEGWDRFAAKLGAVEFGIGPLHFELTSIFLLFEVVAVATWLGQLVFTGVSLRLAWEQRWYLVGERSLRIRHGLWSVREQTMTIANIQNMVVRQGPLQRLFGISDLEVYTAGGGSAGGSGEDPRANKDSFHVGRFRGIRDAAALRNKIRERLQVVKASEDPGDTSVAETKRPGDLAAAAQALLVEARALRREAALLQDGGVA